MKKLLFAFLMILFVHSGSMAQGQNPAEMYRFYEKGYIYLKSGEILKAKYQYSANLDKVLIVTDKGAFIMDAAAIEKITKRNPVVKEQPLYSSIQKKYFNITEMGVLVGSPENTLRNPFVLNTSLNYMFDNKLSAGLGAGLEFYKETYIPVFANVMYRMPNGNRVTPYISLQGGYNLPLTKTRMTTYQILPVSQVAPINDYYYYPYYTTEDLKSTGGFLVNPAVGFIYQISDGFGLGLSLGYRYHLLNYVSDSDYKMQVAYNRLSIKLGLIFN